MGFLSDLIGGKHSTIPTSSSESTAVQTSRSQSGSLAESFQRVFGADAYKELFGNASNAAGRAADMVPGLMGTAQTLFGTGGRFLESLDEPLATEDRLNAPNLENEQIRQLSSDLGRFYSEEIDPAIVGRGVSTGTLGGSRGEVARGVAARGLGEEFVRGSNAIRLAGQDRRDRLAASVDTLKGSRIGQGLGALPGLYGLAEAGVSSELMPYLQLSQILGSPTVLSSSLASSASSSESAGESRSTSSGSTVVKGPGLLDVLNTLSQFT